MNGTKALIFTLALVFTFTSFMGGARGDEGATKGMPYYQKQANWWDTMGASRNSLVTYIEERNANAFGFDKMAEWKKFFDRLRADFPGCRAEGLSASLKKATRFPYPNSGNTNIYEIHVAPDGDDSAAGTAKQPLASLQGARDAIRKIKKNNGGTLDKPVRVAVHSGRYFMEAPLRLTPEDSGTAQCPVVYEAADDGAQPPVLSAGRKIQGDWKTDDNKTYYIDLPEAKDGAWKFRQLFVDGKREHLARYPNYDPSDIIHKGWMKVSKDLSGGILTGLGQKGDWIEFTFDVPADGAYDLWIGVATTFERPDRYLSVKIDGREMDMLPMKRSRDWRRTVFSKAVEDVALSAGTHILRIASEGKNTDNEKGERRVHLDAFVFTDAPDFAIEDSTSHPPVVPGETRIVIEAEDDAARTGGESQVVGFMKKTTSAAPTDRIDLDVGTVKPKWVNDPQAEIFMFATWGWFNIRVHVKDIISNAQAVLPSGVERKKDIIYIEGREARTRIWPGNRFYIFNLLSELDAPGEWFLDYDKGRLYYMPRDGRIEGHEILAPAMDRLVEIVAPSSDEVRVEYIALRGLDLRHTDITIDHPAWRSSEDCAVLLENAWHCAIEQCRFINVGGYAVRLSLDASINRIAHNEVDRAGAGGIITRGPWVGWAFNPEAALISPGSGASLLSPIGNLMTSNHIHHCGDLKKYVAGIHSESRPNEHAWAPGNVYSHNHIHDMPRNGIFGFRNQGGYVVEYNHIHDCLNESDDGGLVHFCTSAINGTAPAIYRNNLLYDANAYRFTDDRDGNTGIKAKANGHGVYLDGTTSYATVENNVIRNTRKGCVFIHSGDNNVIRNNILLDDRRHSAWLTEVWGGNRFENNIIAWHSPGMYYANLGRMPALNVERQKTFQKNLVWRYGHENIEVEFNDGVISFEEWQAKGLDAGSRVADPRFEKIDLPNKICRLAKDSPAFELGFKAIDISRVGPLKIGEE